MAFVQVLLPIGERGQGLVQEGAQVRPCVDGEHFLVLRVPKGCGKSCIVKALEASSHRETGDQGESS